MLTRRKFITLVGAGGVAAGLVAVGVAALPGDDDSGDRFPVIRYGQERCAFCGMSIDDPRFAAAWRTAEGSERHFDDIGCLVNAYRRDHPESPGAHYVHDLNDESWLEAPTATFVVSPGIKTPMSYGVAAFASAEAAGTAAAQPGATTYDWARLLAALKASAAS